MLRCATTSRRTRRPRSCWSRLDDLFALVLPAYVREGKSYLSIAIGCTGGRHRSVVLAEEIAERIRQRGYSPVVHHRDIDR